ncbi:hypothetical protein AOLI_G00232120 [Acnodon oligacanthus]
MNPYKALASPTSTPPPYLEATSRRTGPEGDGIRCQLRRRQAALAWMPLREKSMMGRCRILPSQRTAGI